MEEGRPPGLQEWALTAAPTRGRPGPDILMHNRSGFQAYWLDVLNGPWGCRGSVPCRAPGSLARSLSGNLGIPDGNTFWGVGSFSGLVVSGRACGRSLRANASKVGDYICPTSGVAA